MSPVQRQYLYTALRNGDGEDGFRPQQVVHISDRHNILRSKKLALKRAAIDGIGGRRRKGAESVMEMYLSGGSGGCEMAFAPGMAKSG